MGFDRRRRPPRSPVPADGQLLRIRFHASARRRDEGRPDTDPLPSHRLDPTPGSREIGAPGKRSPIGNALMRWRIRHTQDFRGWPYEQQMAVLQKAYAQTRPDDVTATSRLVVVAQLDGAQA